MLDGEDILVVTDGFWDAPKRLRHKMPLKWAEGGSRVLWIQQPPFPFSDWRMPGRLRDGLLGALTEAAPRLWVGSMPPAAPWMYKGGVRGNGMLALHRPLFMRRLKRHIAALDFDPRVVVLFQQAARWDLFERFNNAIRVYYHHDAYGYGHATSGQKENLVRCCGAADTVWCVSRAHRDELVAYNGETHHLPHAVDRAWWEAHRDNRPDEYDGIPSPRIVYTGVFQEKIDLKLLLGVAKTRPDWQLVFVGPVQPKYLDRGQLDQLRARPNTHFLGLRDVEDIPGFLAGADVLMLPYTANENTKNAGLALKFYEYMITGKPMVMTPFTRLDVSVSGLVDVAEGVDEWCDAVENALGSRNRDISEKRIALAIENSYEARLESQRRLLASIGERQSRAVNRGCVAPCRRQ